MGENGNNSSVTECKTQQNSTQIIRNFKVGLLMVLFDELYPPDLIVPLTLDHANGAEQCKSINYIRSEIITTQMY